MATEMMRIEVVDGKEVHVATQLNAEEQAIVNEIESLQKLVDLGRQASRQISELRDNCKHLAFVDENGFPYDIRVCACCGALLSI